MKIADNKQVTTIPSYGFSPSTFSINLDPSLGVKQCYDTQVNFRAPREIDPSRLTVYWNPTPIRHPLFSPSTALWRVSISEEALEGLKNDFGLSGDFTGIGYRDYPGPNSGLEIVFLKGDQEVGTHRFDAFDIKQTFLTFMQKISCALIGVRLENNSVKEMREGLGLPLSPHPIANFFYHRIREMSDTSCVSRPHQTSLEESVGKNVDGFLIDRKRKQLSILWRISNEKNKALILTRINELLSQCFQLVLTLPCWKWTNFLHPRTHPHILTIINILYQIGMLSAEVDPRSSQAMNALNCMYDLYQTINPFFTTEMKNLYYRPIVSLAEKMGAFAVAAELNENFNKVIHDGLKQTDVLAAETYRSTWRERGLFSGSISFDLLDSYEEDPGGLQVPDIEALKECASADASIDIAFKTKRKEPAMAAVEKVLAVARELHGSPPNHRDMQIFSGEKYSPFVRLLVSLDLGKEAVEIAQLIDNPFRSARIIALLTAYFIRKKQVREAKEVFNKLVQEKFSSFDSLRYGDRVGQVLAPLVYTSERFGIRCEVLERLNPPAVRHEEIKSDTLTCYGDSRKNFYDKAKMDVLHVALACGSLIEGDEGLLKSAAADNPVWVAELIERERIDILDNFLKELIPQTSRFSSADLGSLYKIAKRRGIEELVSQVHTLVAEAPDTYFSTIEAILDIN